MEYTIVSGENRFELGIAVNERMEAGWRPQGGLVIGPESSSSDAFLQAMIRG